MSEITLDTPHHRGNCSDCNKIVSTLYNATCFSGARNDKRYGAVFLLCEDCIAKRKEKNDDTGWVPGKYHEPSKIECCGLSNQLYGM